MISREDIIKPLVFLDMFDYPPTAIEVWRFLGVRAELREVMDALYANVISKESRVLGTTEKSLIDDNQVKGFLADARNDNGDAKQMNPGLRRDDAETEKGDTGFYFLPGPFGSAGSTRLTTGQGRRDVLVEKRRDFFHLSERKFKIAQRAAWLLHFIPSIKMIAVCNNFYYREQSDIDFFIITAANRLWFTRFFATIILDIFGLRARGEKTADKVCLSFYLSEDGLNLENVILKPDDPYLAYWLVFLEPIYGQECYNKFWEANGWIKKIFPNIFPKMPVPRRRVGMDAKQLPVFLPLKRFVDWLERMLQKVQWWKIPAHVKEMAALNDNRVVINESMLKFHENDRREYFRDKYMNKLKNF